MKILAPLLGVILCLRAGPGPAQPAPDPAVVLRFGFARSTFQDLNPKDLEASIKVLAQSLGRKWAHRFEVETRVFDNSADFETAMNRDEVQLAILGSWEYSGMDIRAAIEPMFVWVNKDHALMESLLVARRNAGMEALKDLKGREIVLLDSSSSQLTVPWMDVLLGEARLGTPKTFFGRVEVVQKPTAALLPVFFGKRQACALDRRDFQTLTEMNPQLLSALQVIATSPPYLNIIVCLSRKGWPSGKLKADFTEALRELHLEPEGRQILMLFKADRLLPYQESQMVAVRDLRTRYQRLGRKP